LLAYFARQCSFRYSADASTDGGDAEEEHNVTTLRDLMALRQQCPLREKIANVQLSPKPNLLFIVSDQLRFDAIRIIQDSLPLYDGYTKVRTPNIDRLARMGVLFDTAYCVSPSCAPSRTALKTGNSLQRSAIKGNQMISRHVYGKMDWIEQRIMQLESLEQMLVENETYTALTFGKWHTPFQLYYRRGDAKQRNPDITSNLYSFKSDSFAFKKEQIFKPVYVKQLKYLADRDGIHPEMTSEQVMVRVSDRVR
jgi:arylsulfatase A-like enzyme